MNEYNITNLHVYLNANGWGAYKEIPRGKFIDAGGFIRFYEKLKEGSHMRITDVDDFPFLEGQKGHYKSMSEEDYYQAMEVLNGA